jgi:ABC-type cobalamin/Fe3+-siderophores transport system ATPase subunit
VADGSPRDVLREGVLDRVYRTRVRVVDGERPLVIAD